MEECYVRLFNEITDTISALDLMKERLMNVQQEVEEFYTSVDETSIC